MATTLEDYTLYFHDACEWDLINGYDDKYNGDVNHDETNELFQRDELSIEDELQKIPSIVDADIERSMDLVGINREQQNVRFMVSRSDSLFADEPFSVAGYQHIKLAPDHFDLVNKTPPRTPKKEPVAEQVKKDIQLEEIGVVNKDDLTEPNDELSAKIIDEKEAVDKTLSMKENTPVEKRKDKKVNNCAVAKSVEGSSKKGSSKSQKTNKKGKKSKWNVFSMDDMAPKTNHCNYSPG